MNRHSYLLVVLVVATICSLFLPYQQFVVAKDAMKKIRFKIPDGSNGAQALMDQLHLAQNMCVLGLRGKNCGGNAKNGDLMTKAGGNDDLLVAGNGYDRWTHQVKPQVLQSRKMITLTQPMVSSVFSSMSNAREFFSQVYPLNGQSTFYNGLYSHNGGADEIFSRFFEGTFNVHDAQQQYTTHSVSSYDSLNTTLLFKRIIEILPNDMDASLYQQVIDTFGDSVMTSVEYGGVVDSTVSVRQCFSDGNLQNYINSELSSVITGSTSNVPDGYARYHKVSSLDIAGGNPEISSFPQRVASFVNNPVPIRFITTPIYMAFPEGQKRNNMKQIYDQYVNTKSNMANEMVQQLENRKVEEQQKPKLFRAFLRDGRNGALQEVGQYTLSLGQRVDFAQLDWILIYMATNKSPIYAWQGKSPATIVRHEDSSFHIEISQYNEEAERVGVHNPRVLSSNPAFNSCASLVPPAERPNFVYYKGEIIVCSGGQIMLSGDQRSVVFGCPYVY